MKVFFIQNLGFGGVGHQLSILMDHLAPLGHEVSVVALYTAGQNWKWLWKIESIKIQSLLSQQPTAASSAYLQLIKATFQLRNLLKRENIQALYSFQGHIARFITWLATRGLPNTKLIWGI